MSVCPARQFWYTVTFLCEARDYVTESLDFGLRKRKLKVTFLKSTYSVKFKICIIFVCVGHSCEDDALWI